MRKRLSILLIAVLAALPVGVVTAQPASACDRHPCHAQCKVNPDYVYIGEDGMPYWGNGRPVECYY